MTEDKYAQLREAFEKIDDAVVNSGTGAQGIKYNGKMFAMFYKGDLTLQFSPQQVTELITAGKAQPHDPGTGKPMKNRVLVPASKSNTWVDLAKQSLEYMRSE